MKKIALLAFGLCACMFASAQKVIVKGDLKCLSGIDAVSFNFTYNDMTVGKMSEADYINKKTTDYNNKEAGRGDKWLAAWESDKKNVYPIRFCELFSKYSDIICKDEVQAYNIVVNTDFFEPGFNVGVMRQDAFINVTIRIIETSSNSEVATVQILKAPGTTFWGDDFSVASRVGEAYAKAGKVFGARVKKGK
ncbi:MAG: hypothetical protein J6T12_03125 [Salinivirgaceae bacterium]|nr:hypothetical protein [Salinivirgaceae bacterium]MBR5167787.1 hypothetical protein [Salinivirgaceae bacterium]